VSYGRNFRDAFGRSDQFSPKARIIRKVFSLDLKADRESLMRTVSGSKFQTDPSWWMAGSAAGLLTIYY